MPLLEPMGYALNQTRQTYLARRLSTAGTHWTRLCGLMGRNASEFLAGRGLLIVPCHGVHTMGMRFAIDVLYLDRENIVVYMASNLKPWRFAPVMRRAVSVLELPGGTIQSSGTLAGDKIEIGLGAPPEAATV